jgi:hypothetical protein
MGAKRLGDVFNYQDVFESAYGSEATGGAGEIVTCSTREPEQTEGQTGTDVEMWGPACVVFRPKAPDAKGKCQLLTTPIGPALIAIGSRDSRTAEATGAMNAGDAAFCSPTGKVALRCNDDGSISLLKQGENFDSVFSIEKDGTILGTNEWCQFEAGPNGFQVMLPTGESIIVKPGKIQLAAPQVVLNGAVVALGIGASVPLGAIPATSLPPGAPCFGIPHPLPTILVPP